MDGLNLGLSDVSRAARWTLMLVIGATSELLYITVSMSVTTDFTVLYRGMLLSSAVLVVAGTFQAWLHRPSHRQVGTLLAIVITLAGAVIFAVSPLGGGMGFVSALAGLIAIWRARHLYSGKIVSLAHLHFAVDTVALVVFSGYLGLSLMAQNLLLAPFVKGPFVLILLCALAGWMYVLWSIERSATFSQGANRSGLVVMLGLAVVIGLFGLRILKATVFAIFAAFGFAFIPLMQRPLNIGITVKEWQRAASHTNHGGSAHPLKLPPPLLNAHTFHLIVMGFCIAALVGLLLVLWRARPTYASKAPPDSVPIEVVHRRSLTGSGNPFLPTQNPIRLRVQQWLRGRLSERDHWQNGVTVRSLVEDGHASEIEGILEEYESIRYGRTTDI